ncbi:MAG: tRNA (N6-isopentenyl adenosine(37)-C2)-methylthiotransferase MiaB [Ignavibacteria bacterium GWA2_55_11]|nr:MAG: tRNA (N6-isopentenyl adenosine(37)-C2)-methylthiotransferase MiaB [Ignavibacteria bacterium GWA2_55_11]OGU64339.1 MAG: tRNA (N6-isopentenyl adenosine(37)-C2)-methylthiotransferase MiaB [Ignavibacteria bacterium RIFCSPHIGHO2_02_FULL_56_12]OGU71096.1 MAG: tRNA (N6-isopentenyl adenosine(37)-C2)-methylthiotransferase MiaB [Ignavibacteria bacterium RIFCSPLOWO2_12_FULL_56_21]OGU73660.1 MAG: tRNA (N6-isopentenyl adenosine(37)-C2)-methylthiotransferase MiaB [Ignavibacteria bacterium RIFCSPLOWO2_
MEQKKVYVETYGCQMNVADSEVVQSIMHGAGFRNVATPADADVILVNTCAIRENAEARVYGRLGDFKHLKKGNPGVVVGVLGCMAERLRKDLMETESFVDLVVGPDEYRKLPDLVEGALTGEKGIAVRLSRVENYDDIIPLRTDGVSAWVSVMRGCDKFCTFCVVPFTRGRERSRSLTGVVREVEDLVARGFKEVTLLGQNVNSYRDDGKDFADLLAAVAAVDRTVRVRFTTSHPQDMSDKLIATIAGQPNICNYVHLPVQSGSDRVLELMNRTYTADHYLRLVEKIKRTIPGVSLSTDIISGFPTETEEEHKMTVDLLRGVEFDGAFTFKYSPRENTKAWSMGDSVPDEVKLRRLNEIIDTQRQISFRKNQTEIGRTVEVLVEGESKKSMHEFCGRTDTNKTVVFPKNGVRAGEYARYIIERANAATLFGRSISTN